MAGGWGIDALDRRAALRHPNILRLHAFGEVARFVFTISEQVLSQAIKLVGLAPTREEQLDYIKSLRVLKEGWTPELREQYFSWFRRAAGYRGGASFNGFVRMIGRDAIDTLTERERTELRSMLEDTPPMTPPSAGLDSTLAGRSASRHWTVEELAPLLKRGVEGRDIGRGRRMFGATGCFACHRFANEGGAMGPDLTGVGRRFSPVDLLESILEPSRAISDLYGNTIMNTVDGDSVVGRIVYLGEDSVQVNLNMFNPGETVKLDRKNIASMERSKISPMPTGLLDVLDEGEILDLMAYILSGGGRRGSENSRTSWAGRFHPRPGPGGEMRGRLPSLLVSRGMRFNFPPMAPRSWRSAL